MPRINSCVTIVWVFENRIVATVGKENDFTMAQLPQTLKARNFTFEKLREKRSILSLITKQPNFYLLLFGFSFPAGPFLAPYSQAAYDGSQIMYPLWPPVQPALPTDCTSPQAPYNPACGISKDLFLFTPVMTQCYLFLYQICFYSMVFYLMVNKRHFELFFLMVKSSCIIAMCKKQPFAWFYCSFWTLFYQTNQLQIHIYGE